MPPLCDIKGIQRMPSLCDLEMKKRQQEWCSSNAIVLSQKLYSEAQLRKDHVKLTHHPTAGSYGGQFS
jgi:hypothetical protein